MLVAVGKDCVLLSGWGFKSRVAKISFFFPYFFMLIFFARQF